MKITMSEKAESILNDYKDSHEILLLFYDVEGCGCAVNGVPVLLVKSDEIVDEVEQISGNETPLYIYPKHRLFFDEQLELTFENNQLKLKSKNQLFSNHLVIRR